MDDDLLQAGSDGDGSASTCATVCRWGGAIGAVEDDPIPVELIQVRGAHKGIAVAAGDCRIVLIGVDVQEVLSLIGHSCSLGAGETICPVEENPVRQVRSITGRADQPKCRR